MNGPFGPEGCGRLSAAGCIEGGDGPSGLGWWYRRFAAMSFIIPLRGIENQTTALRASEYTPIPLRGLPPKGEVYSPLNFYSHKQFKVQRRKNLPLRGGRRT